jgi:hypothetical protein
MISCCHFGCRTIYDHDFNFLNNTNIRIFLKKNAINQIIQTYKKYKLRKNLYIYSNLLLDKYYNPKSKYIKYMINNFDDEFKHNKRIAYINKHNKLIFFNFII